MSNSYSTDKDSIVDDSCEQKFQSKTQLFAMDIHAAYMKVENFVLSPFHKVMKYFGKTSYFEGQ